MDNYACCALVVGHRQHPPSMCWQGPLGLGQRSCIDYIRLWDWWCRPCETRSVSMSSTFMARNWRDTLYACWRCDNIIIIVIVYSLFIDVQMRESAQPMNARQTLPVSDYHSRLWSVVTLPCTSMTVWMLRTPVCTGPCELEWSNQLLVQRLWVVLSQPP